MKLNCIFSNSNATTRSPVIGRISFRRFELLFATKFTWEISEKYRSFIRLSPYLCLDIQRNNSSRLIFPIYNLRNKLLSLPETLLAHKYPESVVIKSNTNSIPLRHELTACDLAVRDQYMLAFLVVGLLDHLKYES